MRDIEIICINDGSTDGSIEILKEYEQKDNRVKVIDFGENRGVSVARNTGIDTAAGEYIGFVDSDDYVDLDFYEKLYTTAKANDADIAKGHIRRENTILDNNTDIKKDKMYFYYHFTTGVYKNNFLKVNNICFPKGIISGEDPVFAIHAAAKARLICFNDDVYYEYVRRLNSTTASHFTTDRAHSLMAALNLSGEMLARSKLTPTSYLIPYKIYLFKIIPDIFKRCESEESRQCILAGLESLWRNCKHKALLADTDEMWRNFCQCMDKGKTKEGINALNKRSFEDSHAKNIIAKLRKKISNQDA